MVSEEEIQHCVRRGDYYAIRPMLPELRGEPIDEPNALATEFSSADNVLDLRGHGRAARGAPPDDRTTSSPADRRAAPMTATAQ